MSTATEVGTPAVAGNFAGHRVVREDPRFADGVDCPSLAAALAKAIAASQAVGLDSKNEFHGYRYASADAVMQAARGALAANGISVIRDDMEVKFDGHDENSGVRESTSGLLRSTWRVQHESGEYRIMHSVWPFYCERGRPIDKALAGGLTASLGYFLRDLLMLPRLEADDDPSGRDDRGYEPPPRRGWNDRAPNGGGREEREPVRREESPAPVERKLEMPAGYPPAGTEGMGAAFVEHATRQLELAAKTWDDVKAFVLTKTDDKSRCAGDPQRWDPALAIGVATWIEIHKRKMDSQRPAVPTQEAAAVADAGSASTAKNPRAWAVPEGKKTLTPAMALYWQNKLLKSIEAMLRSVKKDTQTATVLAKIEAKYSLHVEKVEPAACEIYKRVIDEIAQGSLDPIAFADPD